MKMDPYLVAIERPRVVVLAARRRRDYRAPVLLLVALLAAGLAVGGRPPLPGNGVATTAA